MTSPDLKTFLRLAYDYLATLQALHGAPQGMREADIRAGIRQENQDSTSPRPSHVFQQLCDHGLIEPLPEQSAVYEPTARVKRLLREFQREQALITPKVIRGHLEQINTDRQRLLECGERNSQSGATRALERLNNELEQIRALSRTNREAILNHVTALRARNDTQSVQERYTAVLEMMDDYIRPLEEIVRTDGLAETQFRQLENTLGRVRPAFVHAPAVVRELVSTEARLRRVRRDVLRHFETARDEVLPLFKEQQQSSMLARGAAKLLQTVHHEGIDALGLPDQLKLLRFNIRTVLDDDAMRGFLLDMRAYTPTPPAPISRPATDEPAPVVPRRDEVLADVLRSCPVDDVLAWLSKRYVDANTLHLLAAYRYVLQSQDLHVAFVGEPRTYTHGSYILTATPARVLSSSETPVSPALP